MLSIAINLWQAAVSYGGDLTPPAELFVKDTGDGSEDNILLENGTDNLLLE